MNKIRSHLHIFKELLNLIYFIFIFTTNQNLWAHELMRHIISCDYSLGRKYIIKFILLLYDSI
jgi:hypothetical protein